MKITEFTKYQNEEEKISHIETLDHNKNITEEIDFDDYGNQINKTVYTYNEQNKANLVIQYDEDNQLIEKKNIDYDNNGKEESVTTEFPDGSISKEYRKKEGNSITIITEDEDGEFEGSIQHIIDENEMTKELIRTNFMNKVDSKLVYEYDDKKQATRILEQDPKGRFLRGFSYQYDENGNRTTENELNKKNQVIARTTHKYEGSNLISSQAADQSVYYHYENNQVIKEERLNPDGSSDIIKFNFQNNKINTEKHFNIPQGEATDESFLMLTKRYLYEEE